VHRRYGPKNVGQGKQYRLSMQHRPNVRQVSIG
jgi:hypothetical protein